MALITTKKKKPRNTVPISTQENADPRICVDCHSQVWELRVTHKIPVHIDERNEKIETIRLGSVAQCGDGVFCSICGKKARKHNNEYVRSLPIFPNMKKALGVPL